MRSIVVGAQRGGTRGSSPFLGVAARRPTAGFVHSIVRGGPIVVALAVVALACGSAEEAMPSSSAASSDSTADAPVPDDQGHDDDGDDGPVDDDGGETSGTDTTGAPNDTGGCDPEASTDEPGPVPGPSIAYTGTQYDFGGVVAPIDGEVAEVDAIAQSIAESAAQTVEEIATRRATLPYGRVDPDPCADPQLTVYPGPPGHAASDQYAVTVTQGEHSESSFVHRIIARKPDTNRELDTSFTSFSFAGAVTVRVEKLQGDATGCIVRPYAAGVTTVFADGACTFTLERPGQVSVEFEPNIHNPVLHPMLVFADSPEVDVPDPEDPNVRWFGPGVHQPGADQPIESGQTIYLAGGAWVEGAFIASGPVQDVVIRGRGVLSGLFLDTGNQDLNKDQPGLIDIPYGASENVVIEGITLVDGPRFNIRALAQYTTIHGVEVMSWWFSTDGAVGGNHSLIENSFIKVNDDSIKLHWGDTIARRNVLWQLENGGTFNLSWNIHDDVQTFHVYDNDVIHAEHYLYEAEAVFRSRHAGSGTLSRFLFEDIRVENANFRLFYLVLENNKWFEPELGYGEIEQVVFRNIHSYNESHQRPNVIRGIDGEHKVRNVSLQNVYTDGACITNAQNGDFAIDPDSTNAIRIMQSADGSCHTPYARE